MASEGEHAQLSRIAELERQGDVQAAEQAAAHWRARAERASALLPRCRAHILASRAAVELAFSGLATACSIEPDPNPNPNPNPAPNPNPNPHQARSIDDLGALSSALFEVKAHMLALEEDLALAEVTESKKTAPRAPGGQGAAARSPEDSVESSAGGRALRRVSKKEAARW